MVDFGMVAITSIAPVLNGTVAFAIIGGILALLVICASCVNRLERGVARCVRCRVACALYLTQAVLSCTLWFTPHRTHRTN